MRKLLYIYIKNKYTIYIRDSFSYIMWWYHTISVVFLFIFSYRVSSSPPYNRPLCLLWIIVGCEYLEKPKFIAKINAPNKNVFDPPYLSYIRVKTIYPKPWPNVKYNVVAITWTYNTKDMIDRFIDYIKS